MGCAETPPMQTHTGFGARMFTHPVTFPKNLHIPVHEFREEKLFECINAALLFQLFYFPERVRSL